MGDEFNASQPIYFQLVQRICKQIVKGDLGAGEKLPSVRGMAIQAGVNPNTIQRVYTELERMDVVETKRGQGTFVTAKPERLRQLRDELMAEHVLAFLTDMHQMGFSPVEIIQALREYLDRQDGNSHKVQQRGRGPE
ncbi:GntR family transcriptional regulator [Alicyclobacillus tolerans]|uniref:GntR family transcriptional regulator n=1 Tax=Alicyclobacillus tolerans TaxID=90970 RepID=UPI001F44BD99|nr:GntR family transcriptional regulator [Alicyclobacillus tolerans]MCF8567917.1 GntR family transcriptional regulator [Alicyclobacillus tolerans]